MLRQVPHLQPERLGDPHQGVHRDRLRSALYCADINRMQISLLSQLFLTETSLLAVGSNCFAKHATILGDICHWLNSTKKRHGQLEPIGLVLD